MTVLAGVAPAPRRWGHPEASRRGRSARAPVLVSASASCSAAPLATRRLLVAVADRDGILSRSTESCHRGLASMKKSFRGRRTRTLKLTKPSVAALPRGFAA